MAFDDEVGRAAVLLGHEEHHRRVARTALLGLPEGRRVGRIGHPVDLGEPGECDQHSPGFLVRIAVGEDPREHHLPQRLRKYSRPRRNPPQRRFCWGCTDTVRMRTI